MSFADTIMKLTRQLYPTGRAFKMPLDGDLELLSEGLALSEARLKADAQALLDSMLPDNDNFTTQDAEIWERRLAIVSSTDAVLEDRKLAIKRKWNHPGTTRKRQHWAYIQAQLRGAGFDVYVYENRFDNGLGGYETKTPEAFSNTTYPKVQSVFHNNANYHGPTNFQQNLTYGNKVVNHIDESRDDAYVVNDMVFTFFIGGEVAGDYAVVDVARKSEFRQLILKLKPAHVTAFLLVNFN